MRNAGAGRVGNLLLAATVVCATSCNFGERDQSDDRTRITFWRTLTGPAGESIDRLVERFNASQDEVRVEVVFKGSYDDLATNLMLSATRGSGPDVALLGTFEIREFAKSGILLDVSRRLDGPDGLDTTDWPGTLREAGTVDGGVYWVPFNVSVPVLYVNETHLEQAGIDAPPDTWDEFFDAARRLTVRDDAGRVTRHGLALWNITWPVLSAIWSEGGEITDRDYADVTLDDPAAAEVMRRFQALVKDGAAIVPDAATGGHRAAFLKGEASMILDSPAPLREFLDAAAQSGGAFRPAAALYPEGAKGRVFAPGGGGLVLRASEDAGREGFAWAFVRFLLSAPQLKEFALDSGYLAFSGAARDLAAPGFDSTPGLEAIHAGAQYIRGDFSVNTSVPVRTAFDEAFQRILIRGEDVETVLREADAKAERELARERSAN